MPAAKRSRAKATDTPPTDYIVLEAITLPTAAAGVVERQAWAPVLNQTVEQGQDLQPRIFSAKSKTAAIRQHTGDGADVVEGTWRAIPFSSWKGGETTKRVTASQRLPLDDVA